MYFSPKQWRVLRWWQPGSPDGDFDAIICDGAVRSGKTLCTGLSFLYWAMRGFHHKSFALCGKTIVSVRRNLVQELLPLLEELGFVCEEQKTKNLFTLESGGRKNTFYLFGGKDEGSAALIQGMTLAGCLLDEVALMPRSFVEQACARCSVPGSRLWFSCNPESPGHWFYREWIQKAEERNALHLHFTMDDNPGLSQTVRERYERMFEGAFYRRFVLGEWTTAQGLVYDFFDDSMLQDVPEDAENAMERWYISCDYGTVNPTSMGLWGLRRGVWYRTAEFYYDSKIHRRQKTDQEYAADLERLAGGREIQAVIVDPSAASFMLELRRRGWRVRKAVNDVISGIRTTAQLLKSGKLVICRGCGDTLRELGLYRWAQGEDGQDRVCKADDHAMDEMRYFAATVAGREGAFFAGCVERSSF